MRNLISLKDMSRSEIEGLLNRAEQLRLGAHSHLQKYRKPFAVNLFFEPSTRTKFSFEIAQRRLGMEVLNFAEETSSCIKGETDYDTLKTLEAMGVEIGVVRWTQEGRLKELQNKLSMSLVNAGEGATEHPTQALLDMLTMKQEFGTLEDKKVAIIGDIKHSRVASSLYHSLPKMGAKIIVSGPKMYINSIEHPFMPIDEAIRAADVVMMLRIQWERHKGYDLRNSDDYLEQYGLTENRVKTMKPGSIIMHPAPFNRNVEIESSVVECPKSRIFKQVSNGVFVRMAVLEAIALARMESLNTSMIGG
jgi:aspartate carbamoyltransferase catalytic subunit